MNRVAAAMGIFCLIVTTALAIALVVDLVISIFRHQFAPLWFWLAGAVLIGLLGAAAGALISTNRKEPD